MIEYPRLQTQIFPDSPPYSPPPKYSSIVQHSDFEDVVHHAQSSSISSACGDSNAGKPMFQRATAIDRGPVQQSWAYIFPSQEDGLAEAAEDNIVMSATNKLGPVNPFELSVDPMSSTTMAQPRQSDKQVLRELLGDLKFPVELPASSPGPPPGYPRRASELLQSNREDNPIGSKTLGQPHRQSMPELPAVPKRRPVPSHMRSDPQVSHHVDATIAVARPIHQILPIEKMLAIKERNGKQDIPIPVQDQAEDTVAPQSSSASQSTLSCIPHTPLRSPRRLIQQPQTLNAAIKRTSSSLSSSIHDQKYPAPSSPRPSFSQAQPIPLSPPLKDGTVTPPRRPTSAIASALAISSPLPLPPEVFETASVARRYRQRDMMDLLESLETQEN